VTSSSAKFEVRTNVARRIVCCSMSGTFDERDMRAWCELYRREGTIRFRGMKHMVFADMRGMKTLRLAVANIMSAEIRHARENGASLFAQLSDDTVQRLQLRRVVRQSADGVDITVDVLSYEEAERVLARQTWLADSRS
jgi:hypothetical protein